MFFILEFLFYRLYIIYIFFYINIFSIQELFKSLLTLNNINSFFSCSDFIAQSVNLYVTIN